LDELRNRIIRAFRNKDREGAQVLYLALYEIIKVLIVENEIPGGVLLPSTRKLADALALSRSTVNRAYELLLIEGFVEARQGSGFRVLDTRESQRKDKVNYTREIYPALSQSGRSFLANIGNINPTDEKEIAFRPGLPPLDIFPVKQWQQLHNFYWKHVTYSDLSYYPTSGVASLKKNLANYLNLSRGIKCDYEQIIVVAGSLQSLFLTGKTLIEPGDGVVMENPTFPNVYTLFNSLNARIHALPLDEEGLNLAGWKHTSSGKIKLIHLTPSSHYPSGNKMTLERRKELLSFARSEKTIILENDYEHELTQTKNDPPTLFSLDEEDRVIYLGTFNRLLHPAIRMGFMVVPHYLLEAVRALQQMSHRFISPSTQYVMNQFIERKYLTKHLNHLKIIAGERKSRFRSLFEDAFNGRLTLTNSETDVLHMVAELPEGISETKYIRILQENNIAVHPLTRCYIGQPAKKGFIIGYSCVPYPVMRQKVQTMAHLYKGSV
jgi:GntR family transcriptional regulator/MocR family aminotransferase